MMNDMNFSKGNHSKIYLVGGAVRDLLMGNEPRDRDYLVIHSSPSEMARNGFQEVGKSHTVYLHPETKYEYTLTDNLKEDLGRRDLTMNSLAMQNGEVIDYFGGLQDIRNKILRSIKDENFFKDPVRVYRVARFRAQFPDFSVSPSTLELMQKVALTEEFRKVDGERIFLEMTKSLVTRQPEIFFQVISRLNALQIHFKDLTLSDTHLMIRTEDVVLRFGSLFFHKSEETVKVISDRVKVPNDWKEAGLVASVLLERESKLTSAEAIVEFFQDFDVFRRPFRFSLIINLLKLLDHEKTISRLEQWYKITSVITYQSISGSFEGKDISEAIKALRTKVLRESNSI